MKKLSTKLDKSKRELEPLKIGDSLSHSVNLETRQAAYDAARALGIVLCIQRLPLERERFQVTRIK
jgi:hypothetical protein